jgi:hypothetical protein
MGRIARKRRPLAVARGAFYHSGLPRPKRADTYLSCVPQAPTSTA